MPAAMLVPMQIGQVLNPLPPAPNVRLCSRICRCLVRVAVPPISAICGAAACIVSTAIADLCFTAGMYTIGYDRNSPAYDDTSFFMCHLFRDVSFITFVCIFSIFESGDNSVGITNLYPLNALLTMGSAYISGIFLTSHVNSLVLMTNSTPGVDKYDYYDGQYHFQDLDGNIDVIKYYSKHNGVAQIFYTGIILSSFFFSAWTVGRVTVDAASAGAAAVRRAGNSASEWMNRARPMQHLMASAHVVIAVMRRCLRRF